MSEGEVGFLVFVALAHLVMCVIATPQVLDDQYFSNDEKLMWLLILWLLPFLGAWLLNHKIDLGWTRSSSDSDGGMGGGGE